MSINPHPTPLARAPTVMRRPRQVRCAVCADVTAESDILLHHCQRCADALAGVLPAGCAGPAEAKIVTLDMIED